MRASLTYSIQVRVWLLTIPIPGVPARPVAIMPIRNQVARPELRKWHDEVERKLAERGIHHVSYNVDGVSTERGLTHDLLLEAVASGRVHTWSFKHPLPGKPSIHIEVPLLENGKPRVSGSDGKHAKKNARGAALSGARVLALGRYLVHFGQLMALATSERSPLLKKDIIGLDKQDDRAAARLFASAVIRHIEATQPDSIGLAIYTYIIGSIIDAQQNRKISHSERLVLLFRGRFFLEGWREYIASHPMYSTQTHFIAPELYDILHIFINSMVALIFIYRDFFPAFILMLWLHSTEMLEHFYGCARADQADFTMAEFVRKLKKIVLLMHGQIRVGVAQAQANSHRGGYHHFYHNTAGMDVDNLRNWPSNEEAEASILTAWCEAEALLKICGMGEGYIPSSAFLPTLKSSDLEVGNISSDFITVPSAQIDPDGESVPAQLNRLLRMDNPELPASVTEEAAIINAGLATTSFYLHEAHQITGDDDPDSVERAESEMFQQARDAIAEMRRNLMQRGSSLLSATITNSKERVATCSRASERPSASTRYATEDGKFSFQALATERELHETDEAKSAVASRWTKAAAADAILSSDPDALRSALQQSLPSGTKDATLDTMKSSLVSEITRALSAKLAQPENTTTGVSRRARWTSGKAIPDAEESEPGDSSESDDNPDTSVPRDGLGLQYLTKAAARKLGRRVYEDIEMSGMTHFSFVSSGINSIRPLREGSWVAVVFREQLHVGQGARFTLVLHTCI
jgi:hypothetical protein